MSKLLSLWTLTNNMRNLDLKLLSLYSKLPFHRELLKDEILNSIKKYNDIKKNKINKKT